MLAIRTSALEIAADTCVPSRNNTMLKAIRALALDGP